MLAARAEQMRTVGSDPMENLIRRVSASVRRKHSGTHTHARGYMCRWHRERAVRAPRHRRVGDLAQPLPLALSRSQEQHVTHTFRCKAEKQFHGKMGSDRIGTEVVACGLLW